MDNEDLKWDFIKLLIFSWLFYHWYSNGKTLLMVMMGVCVICYLINVKNGLSKLLNNCKKEKATETFRERNSELRFDLSPFNVKSVLQSDYDKIKLKDDNTIYVVADTGNLYLGNGLIGKDLKIGTGEVRNDKFISLGIPAKYEDDGQNIRIAMGEDIYEATIYDRDNCESLYVHLTDNLDIHIWMEHGLVTNAKVVPREYTIRADIPRRKFIDAVKKHSFANQKTMLNM